MKKVYFHSTNHPCPENAMNENLLKRYYKGNDWVVTRQPDEADFIIVSTCGFSKSEEEKELKVIEELKARKKAGAEVILTGCLPLINKAAVEKIHQGPYVQIEKMTDFNRIMEFEKKIETFDNHTVSEDEYDTDPRIHFFFRARKRLESLSAIPGIRVPRLLYTVPSEKWFLIRVAMGCTGRCSYCGIKHAHGKIHSDPIDTVIKQVEKGVAKGFREIGLTGEDQGGYGFDLGIDLADLLKEVLKVPGDFVVNLRYIDPHWLTRLEDKLLPIFATGRIKAFCSPIQSGSDPILKKMNRQYTAADVEKTVSAIARQGKVGLVSTNIIVGFPGETEEDFHQSLELVRRADFGMYMVFKYEDRPGTVASRFGDKIAQNVMDDRYRRIHRAVIRRHLKFSLGV